MKITDMKREIDHDTYSPIMKIEVEIPLEEWQDACAQLDVNEFASILGREFIEQLKAKMEFSGFKNA
jgi:hypothetical protein